MMPDSFWERYKLYRRNWGVRLSLYWAAGFGSPKDGMWK